MLAIVGVKDPCRPSVKDAVRICTEAGVKVRMVTGDNLQTAKAIALECGILASNEDAVEPNIIEGKVFRELSEQERKHICGMTGDGVNDGPTLKKADIGIAVADATDAARGASDIVLTEPGLSVIISAVLTSRAIFQSMTVFFLCP